MLTFGADRSRVAGGKVILQSAIPKGWTARTAKTNTRGEHPGTTVLWEDAYFEVISADPIAGGGVRYVLAPWPDDATIRVFESYDAESEARRIADHEAALRQQRRSVVSRLASVFLGYLPSAVQNRLANELGVTPSRMTVLSTFPSVLFAILVIGVAVDAAVKQRPSPVPLWLWFAVVYMLVDSGVRFYVTMSQPRGLGSLPGIIVYIVYWLLSPHRERLVHPFREEKGESTTFTLPPDDDVALRDSVELRGAMLTLLSPAEQNRLAATVGYDYRRHASGLAWIMLICATVGAVASWFRFTERHHVSALFALATAVAIVVEQVIRLAAFRRGPAGSMFGPLVRPFVRDLLAR